jgi:hypothetical protein
MIPSLVSGLQHVGESLPGTLVTASGVAINASPTPGTAGSGALITITSGAQVAVNSITVTGTSSVTALYYIGSTCFQKNASNNWYGPVIAGNGGSGPLAAPQPTVTLSNSTVTAGAAAGSTVGTLSVTTGAGSYAWAYALSGTNSGSFQISGSTLQTSAVLSTGSYGPLTISASNNTVIGTPFTLSASVTANAGGATTYFSIAGGLVRTPASVTWTGRGVAIPDSGFAFWVTNSACQPLTTLFPGINILRVASASYYSASTYAQQTAWCTAAGIVVLYENHQHLNTDGSSAGGSPGVIFTGSLLSTESAWYAALATQFLNNPYVWFGTNNEPSIVLTVGGANNLPALLTWQQATYAAIRATGNNTIIEIEGSGTGPAQWGSNTGWATNSFSSMKNIVFGEHFYSWIWNGQTNATSQATIYSSTIGSANSPYGGIVQITNSWSGFTSQDGAIPCGCFEFGTSTTGSSYDLAGYNNINAVFQAVTGGTLFCFIAWWVSIGDPGYDQLLASNTTLSNPYGTDVAAQIAINAAAGLPFAIGTSVSTPTGNAINVNLTSQTGATVGPELFGVSQSTSVQTWNGSFNNSGWVAAMAALDLRSWRLQGESLMQTIFGSPTGTTPNWSVLAPLVANLRTALPNAKLFWTIYDSHGLGSAWWVAQSQMASQCTQLAQYLESQGIHVSYWDLYNEPDGSSQTAAQQGTSCGVVYPQMAALGLGYQFGTPPTYANPIVTSWQQAAITAYPGIFYLSGHCYAGPTDAGSVGQDLSWSGPGGTNNPFNRGVDATSETFSTGKLPFALTEYQFGWSFTNANTSNQVASCAFGAMIAYGGQHNILWEAGVWDGAQSSSTEGGSYGWGNSTANQGRQCFMLSNGGRHMQGSVVNANWLNVCNAAALAAATTAGATGSPQITVLATTGGLMVVNSDGATGTGNVTVALGGLLNTTLHQWQQSNSTPNTGTTTVIAVTGSGANATITGNFPALSVTIFYP